MSKWKSRRRCRTTAAKCMVVNTVPHCLYMYIDVSIIQTARGGLLSTLHGVLSSACTELWGDEIGFPVVR